MRRFPARLHVKVFAHGADHRRRVARGGEHPAQEKEVPRLNGRHLRAKRRWRVRQMNAELGETVLGGGCVCRHDDSSFQLPAAEMCAAVDVQDVTGDRCGVGQVHDRVRDVLVRRRPATNPCITSSCAGWITR